MGKPKFKIVGLNLNKKIKFFIDNGFDLSDISLKDKELVFSIENKQTKDFLILCKKRQITLDILKKGSAEVQLNFFKNSLIFFLCLVFGLLSCHFVLDIFAFKIRLSGADEIIRKEIYANVPKINLFSPIKKSDVNTARLEEELRTKVDEISLVSINFVGATLFINIKQKNDTILKEEPKDIIAPYDGVVETVDLYAGTAMVKTKSVVKKGDILVEAMTMVNGQPTALKPEASIVLLATLEKRLVFYETKDVYTKTGKSFTKKELSVFNKTINLTKQHPFVYYEKQHEVTAKKLFYPLAITKKETRFFELKKEIREENFADKKEELEATLLKLATDEVGENETIASDVSSVKLAAGIYLIRSSVQFRYTVS